MKIVDNLKLRENDVHGSGAFGASRTHGKHQGVDVIVQKNDYVYAPFSGTVTKFGYPYHGDTKFRYIEITGDKYKMRIMYAELDPAFKIGSKVISGNFIGTSQDISEKYLGITPHLHVELRTLSGSLLDPTNYLKKKA